MLPATFVMNMMYELGMPLPRPNKNQRDRIRYRQRRGNQVNPPHPQGGDPNGSPPLGLQLLLWVLGWVCPPIAYVWGLLAIVVLGKDKGNAQGMRRGVKRLVSKFAACTRGFLVHAWGFRRTRRRKLGIGKFAPKFVPPKQGNGSWGNDPTQFCVESCPGGMGPEPCPCPPFFGANDFAAAQRNFALVPYSGSPLGYGIMDAEVFLRSFATEIDLNENVGETPPVECTTSPNMDLEIWKCPNLNEEMNLAQKNISYTSLCVTDLALPDEFGGIGTQKIAISVESPVPPRKFDFRHQWVVRN